MSMEDDPIPEPDAVIPALLEAADRDLELQRLRERVELQFRHVETLVRALGERGGASRVDTVTPRLPAREPRPLDLIPATEPAMWWPSRSRPDDALVPTPGAGSLSLAGIALPTTAVLMFGIHGAAVENVVRMISARQRRSMNFKPVFLTDDADFAPFRAFGYAFEYLPEFAYGTAPHLRPTPRAAARMKLLQQKWNFESVIDLTPRGQQEPEAAPAGDGDAADNPAQAASPRTLREQVAAIRASGLFDEDWYRARYPDAAGAADAVEHYLTEGAVRGYDPSPVFLTAFYARQMIAYGP